MKYYRLYELSREAQEFAFNEYFCDGVTCYIEEGYVYDYDEVILFEEAVEDYVEYEEHMGEYALFSRSGEFVDGTMTDGIEPWEFNAYKEAYA